MSRARDVVKKTRTSRTIRSVNVRSLERAQPTSYVGSASRHSQHIRRKNKPVIIRGRR